MYFKSAANSIIIQVHCKTVGDSKQRSCNVIKLISCLKNVP